MDFKYLFLCIILIHEANSLTSITISPKSNVIQGVKVTISCSSDSPTGILKWSHNKIEVAEDNMSYNKENLFEIQSVGNRFDLIIKNATLKHRGIWSCKHPQDDPQTVSLNVSVPWTLKAISIKKIPDEKLKKIIKANNSNDFIETGQKNFPYNLLLNETLEITCQSECGLPAPLAISFQYGNSTNNGELSSGKRTVEICPDKELKRMFHTLKANCLANGLVGRNEIMCQAQGVDGNILSNKPIFILCPAYRNVNELTKGEMIAIAVSMFLAVFDVVIIVMLLKQNCRQVSKLSQSKSEIIRCPEVML